jgi:hypothetical protein
MPAGPASANIFVRSPSIILKCMNLFHADGLPFRWTAREDSLSLLSDARDNQPLLNSILYATPFALTLWIIILYSLLHS